MNDLSRLALHTITTKPWDLATAVKKYKAAGVTGITVWTDAARGCPGGVTEAAAILRDSGLQRVSYARGGFFTALDESDRRKAIDENKTMIDEAAEMGLPVVVLVSGATPGQSLDTSRAQIAEGIAACLDHAARAGVTMGIEAIHPMYADTRSAINTLAQANDLCERLDHPNVGVVVDVYHSWWDERLEAEMRRAGEAGRLLAFHVNDWKTDTDDFLLDRGLMGEGVVDIKRIRRWVESAGFNGPIEVEIFSNHYWSMDQDAFLAKIVSAYQAHV